MAVSLHPSGRRVQVSSRQMSRTASTPPSRRSGATQDMASQLGTRPGKHRKNYGKIHHFSWEKWENPLFRLGHFQ